APARHGWRSLATHVGPRFPGLRLRAREKAAPRSRNQRPPRLGGAAFLPETFSATAARMSAFRAGASISSPSWMSMARRAFPSRLELKWWEGAFREAPLEKVIFTTFLYVSPVQTIPLCDQTGGPIPFH